MFKVFSTIIALFLSTTFIQAEEAGRVISPEVDPPVVMMPPHGTPVNPQDLAKKLASQLRKAQAAPDRPLDLRSPPQGDEKIQEPVVPMGVQLPAYCMTPANADELLQGSGYELLFASKARPPLNNGYVTVWLNLNDKKLVIALFDPSKNVSCILLNADSAKINKDTFLEIFGKLGQMS